MTHRRARQWPILFSFFFGLLSASSFVRFSYPSLSFTHPSPSSSLAIVCHDDDASTTVERRHARPPLSETIGSSCLHIIYRPLIRPNLQTKSEHGSCYNVSRPSRAGWIGDLVSLLTHFLSRPTKPVPSPAFNREPPVAPRNEVSPLQSRQTPELDDSYVCDGI